jgi:membrane-bound inhibitor of C-type lysozyme
MRAQSARRILGMPPLRSFRRKPESICAFDVAPQKAKWIPAFAGMTVGAAPVCIEPGKPMNLRKMSPMPRCTLVALALSVASDAFARSPVTFAGLEAASSSEAHYACAGGKEVTVAYVNASNGDSFAYLPVDGTKHVFVSVMSGSGVRYASGRYIWWSKGDTGTLVVDGDESAPPVLADCVAKR